MSFSPKSSSFGSSREAGVIQHVLTHPKGRVTYERFQPELKDFDATQDALIEYGIAIDRVDLAAYLDDRFAKQERSTR